MSCDGVGSRSRGISHCFKITFKIRSVPGVAGSRGGHRRSQAWTAGRPPRAARPPRRCGPPGRRPAAPSPRARTPARSCEQRVRGGFVRTKRGGRDRTRAGWERGRCGGQRMALSPQSVAARQGSTRARFPPPRPSLPYKVDTSRPSLRTNRTRLVTPPPVLTGQVRGPGRDHRHVDARRRRRAARAGRRGSQQLRQSRRIIAHHRVAQCARTHPLCRHATSPLCPRAHTHPSY